MNFENKFVLRGKSQHWRYNGGCEYECGYHKGKVEWHHPCGKTLDVGVFLCEAHHSLILGRSKRYAGELSVNKSLAEMKQEIQALVNSRVLAAGFTLEDVDKN